MVGNPYWKMTQNHHHQSNNQISGMKVGTFTVTNTKLIITKNTNWIILTQILCQMGCCTRYMILTTLLSCLYLKESTFWEEKWVVIRPHHLYHHQQHYNDPPTSDMMNKIFFLLDLSLTMTLTVLINLSSRV